MSKSLYLVAVDGSEWAERAANRAIHLAAKAGAKVKLISVIDALELQPINVEGLALTPMLKAQENSRVEQKIFAPLVSNAQDLGVNVSTEVLWGDPVEVLLEKVKVEHASMVFVGRRGRSRLADILLGSVANKLAHQVGVPIVLVP
ncbi:universal stress protein [Endozoicomonas sp. G2_1]|uniref:universal stress protein n=1 Tax=Endozoicomonas sp. G2_1 TaxID=2821091 RepID=UPI001ADD3FB5|nr:universal stress protein [Endozoicomonas sp. G2_1]MBO9490918.1 universal stress protein [Endozoicomonas sp. G2_1]